MVETFSFGGCLFGSSWSAGFAIRSIAVLSTEALKNMLRYDFDFSTFAFSLNR